MVPSSFRTERKSSQTRLVVAGGLESRSQLNGVMASPYSNSSFEDQTFGLWYSFEGGE